jgi:competence protein ComEA
VTRAVRTRSLRMRFLKSTNVFSLGVLVALGLAGAAGQGKRSPLPDAPGKEVVKKLCAICHEIETVVASRRTRIGWERSVEDMIARGAKGSDDEMDAVIEYLSTYFGKINVNTAPVDELEKSLGLSKVEAQSITTYRERNGKIKNFEELTKVPAVDVEKLQAKRNLIAFAL